ncbi:hypothetical protein N7492_005663 [Penicillium capsulatum]|uniref:Uncharacterized protein n=1 Tax=Penicillium capsulatum TaxID=69766 RepID=A0A9W9IA01_9EURO|nr:hypothetical protein N7492_005663 [Penicillium capsulatum]KAJ6135240.1 hypothetical protein N7512_000400 [Penicillium capsulatum]
MSIADPFQGSKQRSSLPVSNESVIQAHDPGGCSGSQSPPSSTAGQEDTRASSRDAPYQYQDVMQQNNQCFSLHVSYDTTVWINKSTYVPYSPSQSSSSAASSEPSTGELRDPPMPRSWLRSRGAQVARWIHDPSETDCPISHSSTKFDQLGRNAEYFEWKQSELSLRTIEYNLLLPSQSEMRRSQKDYSFWTLLYDEGVFVGHTAPGLIAIQAISRPQSTNSGSSHTPHPSEIALTLYHHDVGGFEGLQYVFMLSIQNAQTQHLIMHDMYPSWPITTPGMWEYGTQEYEELLGTRIGRIVGYLVLGGFSRGSRRIVRIIVYCVDGTLEMRFDIEKVSKTPEA